MVVSGCMSVHMCDGGGGRIASHQSAKLETICRQELNANIYRALICTGSSEFPVWVSVSVAELRNTQGLGW